ncbi:Cu+-exporting ATPase [Clostridium acetobutylicum]|uniref:Copper-exporting P-type ATPase n=1 Tax=Clostridium acetobutylicum (strain ATCC 824 / DSM 792 / JCM 1419 / IAM 19013 / LMG 5710 / NBRC 13948 / NRRL B-527 / VKM B-1787 / 2291 / W) TaxID=272562 RepID=Q97D27_CLOAB|nr:MULTISPECIES: heavy metal translocating P-type ATPase [Clostridium]AAK81577.1 Heavy-metal transporting P-type ATPase [Clostridium acetobutylicum ATCC 824]ADZ22699.1 Heavy-metal transporting P-type ATPase [Clostridium acetobutylicum EA 2018]AEI34550.1 heavy-metal transporting P-type ATPase [Clostridium acetobutylicum DSM 1731]AWV80749.1 copper-translocating P-type ATPase [Clostridium acetobutylicum]MBC2393926.1 copper-translocating P-type ATPase [Clostridium acetobutylicum]
MDTKTLRIEGMTCAACARAVERATKKLEGVEEANVNLATEKLTVSFQDDKVSVPNIQEAIEKAGYKALTEATNKTLAIGGMTCAACAKTVERVTSKLEGVTSSSVNLATEKLSISFEASKVSINDIKQAIEKAGYKASEEVESVDTDKERKEKVIKNLWKRFIISAVFAVPLLIIAMVPMIFNSIGVMLPSAIDPMNNEKIYGVLELILVLPVMFQGRKFFQVGFKTLIKRSPNMDSLVAIGSSAAFVYSLFGLYQIFTGINGAQLYFESAGIILTLITLGKYMEAVSKGKTSEAIKKLVGLTPKTALVVKGEKEEEVAIEEVKPGDVVIVKPGSKIPVDGIVIEGNTSIDESMLTGESIPVSKGPGDEVIGASINKNGSIKYKVTKVGKDTVLSQIVKLVEDAQGSKAPIAKLADIVSGYFVPVVITLAIISSLAWYLSGENLTFTLTIFISVLVIACPCALGLATPTAIMVGTGKGAEYGVLIKNGTALENTHKIKTIVFDKTGTITEGKPKVTDIKAIDEVSEEELLKIAASVEKASEHPLGEAIVKEAEFKGMEFLKVSDFKSVTGHGIEALIDSKRVLLGNKKLMDNNNIEVKSVLDYVDDLAKQGKTPMYIAIDKQVKGIIAVADSVKESSAKAIKKLHDMGIEVAMITGDNKRSADAIAKKVGIDRVLAEVLPEDKASEVKKLQAGGKKVAMVGDGINDAPALAQADIGMAIGKGTDIAMESADIVLMKSDLMDVITAIELSKKTIKNIKENLFWAFGYNVIGIPVAMGILYIFGGPLLNPMIAAAAMSLSSVSVLTNALRLKRFKPEYML